MKREKFNNRKRRNVYFLFLLLLFGVSMGYAILNANLIINGNSSISANTWDVHWENVKVKSGSTTNVTTPATIKDNTTEVEFNVTLSTPGEYYEFTVDAVNAGTIDAMTSDLTQKVYESNGTTETTLPSYLSYTIMYEDGATIANNHILKSSKSEKYLVRVYYKKDIEASQLPTSAETYVFKFGVNYIQSGTGAINKPDPSYTYTINQQAQQTTIGNPLPTGITTYNTFDEASTASTYNIVLAHVILDNTVYSSSICYKGNTATYCLRGGVDESSLEQKDIYEKNKEIARKMFNVMGCPEDETGYVCSGGGVTANILKNGKINIYNSSYECDVKSDGSSYCYLW